MCRMVMMNGIQNSFNFCVLSFYQKKKKNREKETNVSFTTYANQYAEIVSNNTSIKAIDKMEMTLNASDTFVICNLWSLFDMNYVKCTN